MPTIETRAVIPADPNTVFDLIRSVEDFPQYTRTVEKVTPLAENRYRWKTRVAGKRYEWDVEVLRSERPEHISWRSLTGIRNSGQYHLRPIPGGTEVRLRIEFTLNNKWLDATIGRAAAPLIRSITDEVLTEVRKRFLHTPTAS
jgi:uncharacterized membrane protein